MSTIDFGLSLLGAGLWGAKSPIGSRSGPSARAWDDVLEARADLHRLVNDLPDEAVGGAALLLRSLRSGRIDPDQTWFWTPEWQEGEREAEAQIAAGQTEHFESDEDFLAALERDLKPLQ